MQEKFNQQQNIFSERLKCALKKYPFSKGQLAQRIGVSPVTISRWLGGRVPETQYAQALASELSVRFNWLIFGEGEMVSATPMVTDEVTEYRAKPIIQSVEDGAKNSTATTLWERISETAANIAEVHDPKMRLKFSRAIITMIEAANEKDLRTINDQIQ